MNACPKYAALGLLVIMRTIALIAAICLFSISALAAKVEKPINFALLKPNPMIGDWQGEGGVVAQVFTAKDGSVQANLLKGFDLPGNPVVVLNGVAAPDGMTVSGGGWTGAIQNGHFTGSKGADHFDLQPVTRVSPTLGAAPPPGAV